MSTPPKVAVSLLPPFTKESAILKVRAVEDKWNTRNAEQVASGYMENCYWRNRAEFIRGRAEVVAFLHQEMERGTGLPPHQRALVVRRQQDRRSLRL